MVKSAEYCKSFLSRDWEYDGNVKLTCISRSFSNYLFKVHYEINIKTLIMALAALMSSGVFRKL